MGEEQKEEIAERTESMEDYAAELEALFAE